MINAECWNIEPDLVNYHERESLDAMRDNLSELNFSKKYPKFGLRLLWSVEGSYSVRRQRWGGKSEHVRIKAKME